MSNYRVRQVMALKGVNHRQRYWLVGFATWLEDDSLSARVSVPALIESSGLSRNTWRIARRELEADKRVTSETSRGRGHLGLWTVHCLPEKGGNGVDPNPVVTGKGVNVIDLYPNGEKGSIPVEKRGQVQRAELGKPDHGLNRRAKTLLSLYEQADAALTAETGSGLRREGFDLLMKVYEHDPAVRSPVAVLRAAIAEGRLASELGTRLSRLPRAGKESAGRD